MSQTLQVYIQSCYLMSVWLNHLVIFGDKIWKNKHKLSYLRWAQRGHRSGRVGRRGEWPAAAGGSVWCFYLAHSSRRANWENPSAEAEGNSRTLHGLLEEGAFQKWKGSHKMHRCLSGKQLLNKTEPQCWNTVPLKLGMLAHSADSGFNWAQSAIKEYLISTYLQHARGGLWFHPEDCPCLP